MTLLLIPLLPFLGFLLNAGLGKRVTKAAAGAVACGAMLGSLLVSLVAVWRLAGLDHESRAISNQVFTWISSGDFTAAFTLRLDPLSSVMILVITGIGSLIHVYSTAYMHEESDAEYARYFSYLNLFAAFMLVLVLGSNFLVMFVGWEGVGLCSYLLIGFWYQKKSASDAGKKAFIVNRIGDFGFILGVLLAFVRFGTVDFLEIARASAAMSPETAFGTPSSVLPKSSQPWYPAPNTRSRPVAARPIRTAAATASAPVLRNRTRSTQGSSAARRAASRSSSTGASDPTPPRPIASRAASATSARP